MDRFLSPLWHCDGGSASCCCEPSTTSFGELCKHPSSAPTGDHRAALGWGPTMRQCWPVEGGFEVLTFREGGLCWRTKRSHCWYGAIVAPAHSTELIRAFQVLTALLPRRVFGRAQSLPTRFAASAVEVLRANVEQQLGRGPMEDAQTRRWRKCLSALETERKGVVVRNSGR